MPFFLILIFGLSLTHLRGSDSTNNDFSIKSTGKLDASGTVQKQSSNLISGQSTIPTNKLAERVQSSSIEEDRLDQSDPQSELNDSGNLLTTTIASVAPDEIYRWRLKIREALSQYKLNNQVKAEGLLQNILRESTNYVIQIECLKNLANFAEIEKKYSRAQQIYSQLIARFPKGIEVPEILFRQGRLHRKMGADALAISKFYAVLSTVLVVPNGKTNRYKTLVLLAQTEIAESYFLEGNFKEAAVFFKRILKLQDPELNEAKIRYKLIKSVAQLGLHQEVIAEGRQFISKYTNIIESAEVRFMMSDSFRRTGRVRDALEQTLRLLTFARHNTDTNEDLWVYWQQRTGNDLANQLYNEGDYLNALQVYKTLANLQDSLIWQVPAWYQVGLVYERLGQTKESTNIYENILLKVKEIDEKELSPSLQIIFDSAKWRLENIRWTDVTEKEIRLAKGTTNSVRPEAVKVGPKESDPAKIGVPSKTPPDLGPSKK